jgi:NDP-4-keto-2,6-dideoxyhexose 3-C-methyltransferase
MSGETPLYAPVRNCRVCGGARIDNCIDLGQQYLGSAFVPSNDDLPLADLKAPLSVVLCRDCGLVQLGETVRRPALFTDYHYRSATNPMMRRALQDFVEDSLTRAAPGAGDAILDTGCNDGTMLMMLPAQFRRIGIEPARNISWDRLPADISIRRGFFSAELARELTGGQPYKLVTSVAMLYSVENVLAFARDVKSILAPDGVWSIQVTYLPNVIERLNFYDICHEHLYYFTLHTLSGVLERCGLKVVDASLNDVNGGSLRVHAVHAERAWPVSASVPELLASERQGQWGVAETYRSFMRRVDRLKMQIRRYLEETVAAGQLVIGLGASTKGNVLLQYFGIERALLPYISERGVEKIGLRTLGTDIELISEERARALEPAAMLVLIWFFKDEIIERERPYLAAGGKLLFPMPYPHLVDASGTHALESDFVTAVAARNS